MCAWRPGAAVGARSAAIGGRQLQRGVMGSRGGGRSSAIFSDDERAQWPVAQPKIQSTPTFFSPSPRDILYWIVHRASFSHSWHRPHLPHGPTSKLPFQELSLSDHGDARCSQALKQRLVLYILRIYSVATMMRSCARPPHCFCR